MRFPIITKKTEWGIEFVNLSEALEECLKDMNIIDPKTHEPRQDYFDLPIDEGPLLGCLSDFFDLKGNFHVGCTADIRPPSFSHSISRGSGDTREGLFQLYYSRELKLSTFLENSSFRNKRGLRDLKGLARAYNQRGNYEETLGIGWHGWIGDQDESGRKYLFTGAFIGLEFDGEFLKEINGVNSFNEEQGPRGPLYGEGTPFYHYGEGTRVPEIAKKYQEQKGNLEHPQYAYHLPRLGLSIADVLFGVLQIGAKLFPVKRDLDEDRIRGACSSYRPVPEDFDLFKEHNLYWDLTGGVFD